MRKRGVCVCEGEREEREGKKKVPHRDEKGKYFRVFRKELF
jgi:hypothetical protein